MKVEVTNIPKDKFHEIQMGICKVLFNNGIPADKFDAVIIEDGISNEFQGFEFEIKLEGKAQIVSSSSGA